jgi:tetratricopeptide (TPR) repeat protein
MELEVLDSLGYVTYGAGQPAEALVHYEQGLLLARERGYAFLQADLYEHLGDTYADLDDLHRARAAWEQSLRLYEAQQRTVGADRVRDRLAACG